MKKAISLILLASIAAGLLSCGSEGAQSESTTAASSDTTEAVTTEKAVDTDDELPERKFDGRTFTVITYDQILTDVKADEANGDVVNDAVFERNQTVEERFDVTLETISNANHRDTAKRIQSSVLAGDDDFELIAHHVVGSGGLALQDLFMNWYEIPYINFEKPWWSRSTTEDLTYGNNVAPLAIGDMALSAMYGTYCYFFDKKGAEDYGLDDLYAVANAGDWTLDYVMEITKDIYKDLNNNNERDEYDYYGLTQSPYSAVNAFLWSSGGKVFENDAQGIPQYVYGGEKVMNIYEKVYELCFNSEGVCIKRNFGEVTGVDYDMAARTFRDDMSLFVSGTLDMTIKFFRSRGEYGILPYPKYDEAQPEYKTMVDGYHAALAVPKTVTDTEFVGIITEALNAESHKIVVPAFYEVALKVKYSHDEESVQMLDRIIENRVFDLGYVYDNWLGVSFNFDRLIKVSSTDFASYYAEKSPAALAHYDEVLAFFESIK